MNTPLCQISVALIFSLYSLFSNGQSKQETKPNIIVILVDDMGYSDLGSYGSDLHETPNIDKLGKSGMIFYNAYSAGHVCTPTRASLLTGKPPVSTGLTEHIRGREFKITDKHALIPPENGKGLNLNELTIAEVLKVEGYATGIVGKWHLGGDAYSANKQGFDYVISADKQSKPGIINIDEHPEYRTDLITKKAIDFVDSKKEEPFFLYLPYYAVHIPLWAKEDLLNKYEKKIKETNPVYHRNARYAAMIETLDTNIGYLIGHLKKEKLLENTLIVLTSDNGGLSVKEGAFTPATSNYPYRAGKGYLYEGGIKVPLMISWPGKVKANSTSEYPVVSYDFMTTISSVCGAIKEMPGSVDFSPIFLTEEEPEQRPIFWHAPHYSNQGGKPAAAVRMGKYKLIHYFEDASNELFNLENDEGEENNLAHILPEIRESMSSMLTEWLEETEAKIPMPNPNYQK
ncbi:sulfatase [Algibacter miyuki]|uniref:Sulfatase n=1 Tax=Algibacter miyuki TaxID=1306933 RepID=A0ABV5H094_9FLAO|nr:sulfatase [Algibacter miyuki]MDN3667588.1 sulfatase [Algibacter miyuki]